MKFQKHSSDQRVTPPCFILIKSMACGLALLVSGQVFATNYYSLSNIGSANDFTLGSKWTTSSCGGGAVGGTITPSAGDYFDICAGYSLTLAATDVVNFAAIRFNASTTWTASGVLKFSSGNKFIQSYNSSLSAIALNVSSMTIGNTITIVSGPSSAYKSITFSSVTGGSLSCVGGSSVTTYIPGNPISPGTTCTVAAAAVNNSVSAPIFSTKEKPAVFSEEVK